MGDNPFADLIPQRGAEQGGVINLPVANPTPVTQYSLLASIGGADEMYDSGTAQGRGSSDNELAPGVVAVNPSVYPIGTIFKDADTGEVFVAGDKHGNANPNVVDIYTPPSQYTGFSGQRNLFPVGRVPANEIPKTAGGVGELLKNFGKVPEGEGAYTSLGKIQQGSQPQQQQMDNPFSDLIPQNEQAQSMGGEFQSAASKAEPNNPYADLIPSQLTPSSFGSPAVSSGRPQKFGDVGPDYVPEQPWYSALPRQFAASAAKSVINTIGGELRGLSKAELTPEEATATFDKSISDKQSALNSLQAVVDKKGFATADDQNRINQLKQQIENTKVQKQATLSGQEFTPQEQADLAVRRQEAAQQANLMSQASKEAETVYGANPEDTSVAAGIGRGLGNIFGMTPAMLAGGLGIPLTAIQAGNQAYAEAYDAKVNELKKNGITDQKNIDDAGHQAGSEAAVETIPQLGAYLIGGKLTSEATGALLKGATPLVKGLAGGAAAAGVNVATSTGLRGLQGQPLEPTAEGLTQDILFGALHGISTGREASAEAKKNLDAVVGGPAPEVAPSANPEVNKKEAEILASAEAQASVPEVTIPEAPKPVEEAPTPAPAGEAKAPAAPADVQEQINKLTFYQLEYAEGSADWNEIQAQIDALQKPAEAPAETRPSVKPSITQEASDLLDKLDQSGSTLPSINNKVTRILRENGIEVTDQMTPEEAINALREKAKQPTEEKPNAIQEPSATEAMLRPEVTRQGEVVELSGVGEKKPEVPAKEAEAPKEEVKPTLPQPVQDEFNAFARKQGGLNKAQAQKALIEYEKAGNILIGDNGEMPFSKKENSSRESLRKAAGIEEKAPESPSKPLRDILNRFENAGEEDKINTLKGLGEEVRDAANKSKSKVLADLATEIEKAVDVGAEIGDAQELVNRAMAELEREAERIEAPKGKKAPTPKKKTTKDKARDVLGDAAEGLSYILENKILDPVEYKRRVKAGIIEGGGEYDFFDKYKLPKKVKDLIFSKTGRPIDVISEDAGFKSPYEMLAAIDEAYRSAEKAKEETKAREKDQTDLEDRLQKMKELEETDPEAHAGAVEDDVRKELTRRLRNEGGYFTLPEIIYDAAVSVGRSVAKGARDFKSWSAEMVNRLGEGVRGFLRRIYNAVSTGGGRFLERGAKRGAVDLGGEERFKPKPPTERETYAKRAYDALAKVNGRPPTLEEMTNGLLRKFEDISLSEVSDLYATVTGRPKPSIAEAKPPVSAEATPEQPATSLKNAYSEAEAKALGFQELTQQDAQEMDAAMDRAKKESVEDPLAGQRLAQSLITNPKRSLTGDESALLLKHKTDLFNSLNRMAEGLTEGSPEQKFEKSLAYDNASRSYYDLLQALKDRGSEWGREGRWRQALLREDYSFATQERLAKSAKREPLTDKEKTELAKQTKRLTEIDKEILETQEKEANQQEQKSIEKELKKSPQYDPYIQSLVDRVRKNVSSAADSARERIRQRRAEGRLFTGVDPTDIADYAVIGADHLLKGVTQFSEWSNRMRQEFGEAIRPYLNDIFKKSQEFNEKQFDKEAKGSGSVKKRIARASSPEERTRKAQETRARNRLEELKKEEERQKNGDFSKPLKKAPVEPSAETKRLREEAAKIKDRINERRAKWEKANRTKTEKVLGGISALNRFNILSHITVLEHLAGAAVENIATRPISSTLAQVMRFNKTLNDIRKKAVYEGGFSARSELKGVYGIAKSAKDVWSKLLKGKASIDWLYGKQYNTAPQFVKMVENVHGAMKEPVRQGIFSRSLQLRIEAAKEMGLDPTHDEVLYNSLASEALNDANMDIFMGDNFLTSGIRGMIRGFERNTESPRLAKFISTLLDLAMPIMNVPTNLAIRKLRLGFGLLEAPTRIAIAAKEGKLANRAEKLTRDEAEKITRAFKYGTLGLLLGIYAWRNSSQFGGLYNAVGPQAPENPELKKGEVKLMGLKFPKAISHGPVASFMNMIADSRRLYDKSVRNNPNSKWSQLSEPTFFGLFVSGLGSLPPAQAATRYFSPFTTGGQKVGQALRDMLIPGAVQDIAGKMDTESQPKNFIDFLEGEPIKRSAKTFEQELMKGIPVMRETLPKSKQKKSGGSSSASSRGNQ